ncbi:hypothetical protein MPNT_10330 [Candidatus Methylacidithermus pantelleriae]|uniref:Uncharacterized protein n=1 Tax=Candidatus Methylacidithermus pantelleriae TaxID=2744239 RepID=A0A8J2FN71_9BACT|nr:hypothetical protein MPNT_10330 [Candidatus Methylacidithermus pantelleriae]
MMCVFGSFKGSFFPPVVSNFEKKISVRWPQRIFFGNGGDCPLNHAEASAFGFSFGTARRYGTGFYPFGLKGLGGNSAQTSR